MLRSAIGLTKYIIDNNSALQREHIFTLPSVLCLEACRWYRWSSWQIAFKMMIDGDGFRAGDKRVVCNNFVILCQLVRLGRKEIRRWRRSCREYEKKGDEEVT